MATRLCERCNRKASDMEVGWGRCVTCGRLLCPTDVQRGCDGAMPAALQPGVESLREGENLVRSTSAED